MSGDRETSQADAPAPVRRPHSLRIAMLIAFGLFYAYDLFEAISNIFGVTDQIARYNVFLAENDLVLVQVPWVLLVGIVVVPIATFVCSALLGRRRGIGMAALLLLAGLAVSAATTLSLTALA